MTTSGGRWPTGFGIGKEPLTSLPGTYSVAGMPGPMLSPL